MKFEVDDSVRVVSAGSPFFGWTGKVMAAYDGDLMTGVKHYRCLMNLDTWPGVTTLGNIMLLFTESELAYA